MVATAYMIEIVGGHWVTVMGIGLEYFWATAWLTLGALALIFTRWRQLLMATAAPGLLSIGLIWLMPESPRWLLAVGREAAAEAVVRRAAATNGRYLPKEWRLRKDDDVKNDGVQGESKVRHCFRVRYRVCRAT